MVVWMSAAYCRPHRLVQAVYPVVYLEDGGELEDHQVRHLEG